MEKKSTSSPFLQMMSLLEQMILRRLIPSEVKKLKNVLNLNHLILSHPLKEICLLSENFEDSFNLGEIDVVNKSHLNCYI